MGLKESVLASSIFIKICLVLMVLAQFCSWIAFTVPEWGFRYTSPVPSGGVVTGGSILGLWRECPYTASAVGIIADPPSPCTQLDGGDQAWFRAVQALSAFGFIGINVGFFILVTRVFTSRFSGDIGFWNAVQCIATGVCYLVAAIIFAIKFDGGRFASGQDIPTVTGISFSYGELRYGFGLAIVAFLLEVASGVLMIVDGKKSSETSPI